MTKDLAILVAGSTQVARDKYLNTFEFIDKVAENLTADLDKPSLAKPVLGYWNIRGRAQAIRFQLAYQGVDYEDKMY